MDKTDGAGTFFMEVVEEPSGGVELEDDDDDDDEEGVGKAEAETRRSPESEEDEGGGGGGGGLSLLGNPLLHPTPRGEEGERESDSDGEVVEEEEEEDRNLYYCKVLFYLCRVIVLFSVVFAGLFNLSHTPTHNSTLWTALLSSCVGYALSARKLRGKKKKTYRRRRLRKRPRRRYRVQAQDDGLAVLHTLTKQQFDGHVP